MTHLRLIYTFFRLGILNEMQYRTNFWVEMLNLALSLLTALGALSVVFGQTESLGGWTHVELLALVGVYFLMRGAIYTVVQPSMELFLADVREGTLDYVLVKPEDAQMLVSIRSIRVWRLLDIVVGLAILLYALIQIGNVTSLTNTLAFGITLLCGAITVYSFWLMLATCAFWFIRIENILVIFESMYQAGRWPIGIYPQFLQVVLTFLVPVAFAVTVPAQALVGQLTWFSLLLAVGVALLLFMLSRWFWRLGLSRYSGASA